MKDILLILLAISPCLSLSQNEHAVSKVIQAKKDYKQEFIPDGGIMQSDNLTSAYMLMAEQNDLQPNIVFGWLGEAAGRLESGLFDKGYSLYGTNHATQTVEASKPYIIGHIAPTEHVAAFNPTGESRFFNLPSISVSGTYTITKCETNADGRLEVTHQETTSGTISSITFNGKLCAAIVHAQALSTEQIEAETALLESIYPIVPYKQIGEDYWATSNYTGTQILSSIPEVTDGATWAGLTTPAWCYYNNDPNYAIYGKLYNWYAMELINSDITALGDWEYHVSTTDEWSALEAYVSTDTDKLKEDSDNYWQSNTGTNWTSFTALPTGFRDRNGNFIETGQTSAYWNQDGAILEADKMMGMSIRLVKNK